MASAIKEITGEKKEKGKTMDAGINRLRSRQTLCKVYDKGNPGRWQVMARQEILFTLIHFSSLKKIKGERH